jgi:hypothetical protein
VRVDASVGAGPLVARVVPDTDQWPSRA